MLLYWLCTSITSQALDETMEVFLGRRTSFSHRQEFRRCGGLRDATCRIRGVHALETHRSYGKIVVIYDVTDDC